MNTEAVDTPTSRSTGEAVLDVRGLTVRYGGVMAVNDVNFEIAAGSIVGLIGPNGAGKTSLIDALTGYHRPAEGQVIFGGKDVTGDRAHRLARAGLTRTFQSVELFDDLTIEENLLVASERSDPLGALLRTVTPRRKSDDESVAWALEVTDMTDAAARRPGELSHGRRKLAGVARAIASRPRLVLLDEPAAGLDTDETAVLARRLRGVRDTGVSMLLVDHDMELVMEICDHVLVLDFGKVIARGTPREIRGSQTVVDAYLGTGSHT